MNVWLTTWDVRNAGTGVEVFATRDLAVEAAIEYAQEVSLLKLERMTVADARRQLLSSNELIFEAAECYYGIEEHEVIGIN